MSIAWDVPVEGHAGRESAALLAALPRVEGLGRARRRHNAGILSRDHVVQPAAVRIVCAVLQPDERSALGHEQLEGSQWPRD